MLHRIFIAINLPEEIKSKLISFQEKWPELPCRWTKKENLHITLIFLGYISNEQLLEILKITKEVAIKHQSFLINLKRVCYGPPKKMPPRMVWVEGEKSIQLGNLQRNLESSLFSLIKKTENENRPYKPHITLGRIRQWQFRQIDPEERPVIEEEISLSFEVNSIEIMESKLKKGGPEYFVLESFVLEK